ncbi:hypothetical protein BLNAU_16303 [Blattamonas nauphoetae]|uniref:Uncharacterized protein n=1 Tax=Blattamonas nauphoetae TaxID=2049346 RepID=A0ABQ9XBX4_9EUKA|nr:hypothetical protein BLNAU_16303 [Blattamonas nauphoetae]
MLGCVVSLTSSHLSGLTIRDVNTVGSVLCSNSSFSSLLHSPNTDSYPNEDPSIIDNDSSQGTVTKPDGSTVPFMENTKYEFDNTMGPSSVIFTNCRFTGDKDQPDVHPLSFYYYPGTISILSCSFENISSTGDDGGAVNVRASAHSDSVYFTARSSNFTSCSSTWSGGAMYIQVRDDVLIDSCQFEDCSAGDSYSAGGLFLEGYNCHADFVDCVFTICTAGGSGAGMHLDGYLDVSVVDSKFEHCGFHSGSLYVCGGGLCMNGDQSLTVERSHFIECSSRHAGGASRFEKSSEKSGETSDCYSGTTGAICIIRYNNGESLSFSHVLFDGNTVGDDTTFFTYYLRFMENTTKFADVAIMFFVFPVLPPLEFEDFFTTITPDSTGMIIGEYDSDSKKYVPERLMHDEFEKIGPLLTAKPTTRMNEKTGKIELEMEGKTPLPSQEYEVTVNGKDGTDTKFRMLFSDGTGTLVSGSESNLKYNTDYMIISIVGVVPESSSSRMTNDIEAPVAAWAFNLPATPNFLTFTTPKEPIITTPDTPSFSTLQDATAHLIESNPKSAFVVLHFDKEVCGSYDFVVLEDGKPVTLTITTKGCSKSGGTKEFKVIGDGKLLTHDTTYTIESLTPTPNTDSPTDVRMNDTITFHIPKSSFDSKKSMSVETKQLLGWLIPLVVCLMVAVILVVIIIIVLLRRRKQKKGEPSQKEMGAQEQVEIEEKMEVLEDDPTKNILHMEQRTHSAFDSSSVLPTNMNRSQERLDDQAEREWVEVMACSGGHNVSVVADYRTLYSVLHKEHREIGKRVIGLQIVNGLKAVLAKRPDSDVVTRLSSLRRIKDSRKRGREKQQSFALSQPHSFSRRKSKSTHRSKRTSLPFLAAYSDSSSYESDSSSSVTDAPPDPVTLFKRKLKKRFPGFKGEWTEVALPPQTRDELFAEAAPTIQALRIRTQFIPPDEIPDEVRSVQDHLLKMSAQSSLVSAALLSNLYAEAARQGNSTLLPQIVDIILLTADAASRTHYSRYLKEANLKQLMDRFDVPQRAGITVNHLPPPPDSYVPPVPHPEHQLQMVAPTVISHMNSGGNFSSRGSRGRAPANPNGRNKKYGRFGN